MIPQAARTHFEHLCADGFAEQSVRLSEEQRRAAGIGQGLVRLAVGLEHPLDVIDDLQRGLSTIQSR